MATPLSVGLFARAVRVVLPRREYTREELALLSAVKRAAVPERAVQGVLFRGPGLIDPLRPRAGNYSFDDGGRSLTLVFNAPEGFLGLNQHMAVQNTRKNLSQASSRPPPPG